MSGIGINPAPLFKPAAQAGAAEPAKPQANPVVDGVSGFKAAIDEAEQAALQTAVSGADPLAMVQALANAELVLDTAVTVRDKVVEAYQELLRMPV